MSLEMENTMVEIILWALFVVCALKVARVRAEERMNWTINALLFLLIIVLMHVL